MIGPAIGSGIVGASVIAFTPHDLFSQFAYLFLTAAFLSLGLSHGTTLALLCGYWFGWWSVLFWLPFFILAQVFGLVFSRMMITLLGSIEQISATNQKWSSSIAEFKSKLSNQGDWAVFWFRMSPVVPFALGTMLLAQTGMKIRTLVAYGTLGAIPRTLAVAQIGMVANSLPDLLAGNKTPDWTLWIGLAFLVVSTLGLTWWAKAHQVTR